MSRLSDFKLAAFLLFSALLAGATATPTSDAVRVDYSSRNAAVTVEVTQASALGAVLDELCTRSAAHCEGTEQLTDLIAPARITGSWSEVVSKLMEGAKMNFVVVPASSSSPAELIVQGRALSPDQPGSAMEVAGKQAAQDTFQSPPVSLESEVVSPPEPSAMPSSVTGESSASGAMSYSKFGGSNVAAGLAAANMDAASEVSIRAMYSQAPGGELPGILPIVGANGEPMARESQMPTVLPFVDGNGNPMAATSTPPTTPVLLRFTDPNASPR